MNVIERFAQASDPGYLVRAWAEANGDWNAPLERDLRAFLSVLAREVK